MNKIIFFDTYADASGGAPKSMLQLIALLNNRNITSDIVTTCKGSLYKKGVSENFNVFVFQAPRILMKRRKDIRGSLFHLKYFFSLLFFWISNLLNAYKMRNEIICFNDIRCFLLFFPFAIFCRHKLIWYVRINDRVKLITDFAVRISNKIILISNSCRKMFKESDIKKYSGKYSTVYTGFPKNKSKVFIKENKIRIGFVGVLSKRKNIELLITALSHIKQEVLSKLEIVVVGDTKVDEQKYLLDIKNYITKLHLLDQFKFIGFVDNVSPLYLSFDAVVMTSFAEGLPRTIIEGLSHGCYIISTDVDGAKEIILDNSLGVVLKEYSATELAKVIVNLVKNKDIISTERHKRVEYVNLQFSEESFINNFIEAIKN